ncbi:MAG: thioesterase family protein [Desulfopila sp.]|jgi:acyl-CoA thioester hydrolase|nr:thioesterase family protein [Desulfopila sp.]
MMTERFQAKYRVTIGDINYGGHLGNDKALLIFQDARLQFFDSFGFSEKDIGDGRGIIMVESGVRYLREVFLHEELSVWISVSQIHGKKFTLQYEIEREPALEPVLRGFTTFLVFDYSERKVAVMPAEFKERILPYISA